MRGVKKNMLTEKTNLDYKKYCISFFYILFFINNFNMNMDDFLDMRQVITTKDFLDKIANVQTEKV